MPTILLHFLRWWAAAHKTAAITKEALTESTFLDYIRCQVDQNPAARCRERQPSSRNRRACHAAVSFPTPLVCLRPAFRTGTGDNHGWAMGGYVRR